MISILSVNAAVAVDAWYEHLLKYLPFCPGIPGRPIVPTLENEFKRV